MSTYTLAVRTEHIGHTDSDSAAAATSDRALFERFLRGDDSAFLALFRQHNRRLVMYCLKIVGSRQQAEDIAQETWERIIALRKKSEIIHSPIGFLMRVARNLCLDHVKTRKQHLEIDNINEEIHPLHSTGEPSTKEELVLAALHRLPFKYREVLILHTYCGYQYDEIAEMLGKSADAIWARASRARAELRTQVAAEYALEQKRLQRRNS